MVFRNVFNFLIATTVIRLVFHRLHFIANLSCIRITSCLTLALLLCLETVLLSSVSDCTKAFYIHWNTTNPIFKSENTDHIISVNQGNTQFEYDQVNIICPVYTPGTHEGDAERYIIYNVSKEEYEKCRITNPSPRIIAICDKPHKLMYYTITFRPFTPQPGGLEFPPGQDYYFISTSSKEDLHRRIGGRCASNNMKVIFKVCCRPEDKQSKPPLWPSKNNVSTIDVQMTTTTVSSVNSYSSRLKPFVGANPNYATTAESPSDFGKYTTKKTQEFRNHPNEVVKNEELSHNISVCITSWFSFYITLAFSTLVIIINR